ncbi:MAG: carboxypeptidase regulatory-like domain-containing protein [Acidobacteria bacterium]|jgi:hypothetical protein|nr:carboxypeptidase regulatory-like domain-containing protein [Acidobacteriota bacterium]
MKRLAVMLGLLVVVLAGVSWSYAKDNDNPGRLLVGRVSDRNDSPLPNAMVYLANTRTRALKTFIVGSDGTYRFPALSPNVDYEVYAQYKGKKSDTKTMSQFDTRPEVTINLRINLD